MPGRAEEEINKFSRTFKSQVPSILVRVHPPIEVGVRRPLKKRFALVSDSGQPKSVTLGEFSKERDLVRSAARKTAAGEYLQCAKSARARTLCLLLYAAISGRNGGMSNERGTRSGERERERAAGRQAGNKPALNLILRGATERVAGR